MTSRQKYESALKNYKEGRFKSAFLLFCDTEELPESKFYIGLSFEKGNGVNKNLEEAVRWYSQSAIEGHPSAMYRLGLCYENGTGIVKSLHQARYWYELGALAGNPGAADHLENLSPLPEDQ